MPKKIKKAPKVAWKKNGRPAPKIATIEFDPSQRTEFITGFHKRKKARRKLATQQIEEKEREERRERRKRKREELQETRNSKRAVREVMKQVDTNRGLLLATPFVENTAKTAASAVSYEIEGMQVQVTTSTLEELEEEERKRQEAALEDDLESEEEEEDGEEEEEADPWDCVPLQWHDYSEEQKAWEVRQSSYLAGSEGQKPPAPPASLRVVSLNMWTEEKWLAARYATLVSLIGAWEGAGKAGGLQAMDEEEEVRDWQPSGPAPDFVCLYNVPVGGLAILSAHPVVRKAYALSDVDGKSFDRTTCFGTLVLSRRSTWAAQCTSPIANRFANTVMGRMCVTWNLRATACGKGKGMHLAAVQLEGWRNKGSAVRAVQLKQSLENLSMPPLKPTLVVADVFSSTEGDVNQVVDRSLFADLWLVQQDAKEELAVEEEECAGYSMDESKVLAMLSRKARRKPKKGRPDRALLYAPAEWEEADLPRVREVKYTPLFRSKACPTGVFASTHKGISVEMTWSKKRKREEKEEEEEEPAKKKAKAAK